MVLECAVASGKGLALLDRFINAIPNAPVATGDELPKI